MIKPVGIRSLALALPREIRENEYYRRKFPDVVADAEQRTLARVFSPIDPSPATVAWDTEMAPYLADPFRGAVERRALGPGETPLTLEVRAARDALEAASLGPRDIDLVIATSLLPDRIFPGNAVYVARDLGIQAPAWNLESACNSSLIALQNATALVRTGEYRRILVVASCSYLRQTDERDSVSWFLGDGAGAFVVAEEAPGRGALGMKMLSTSETCGAFHHELVLDEAGQPRVRMGAGKNASRLLRNASVHYLRTCAEGALRAANVALRDIDFVVVNTPTAWHSRFAARVLELLPEKTLTTYPIYANIGPALTIANLYHAARDVRIRADDLVMLYAVGSSSTTGAVVMRWGDVGLGPLPAPPGPAARARLST